MKKENVLNGWKSFDEEPIDGTRILLVLLVKELEEDFTILLNCDEIDDFRNDEDYELLAWQYCPRWVN